MADPRLSELNRFLRRHTFFTRSSFATFTSSKRRAFERDVCFFAKSLNLPEKIAKEELSKARKFCREDLSNSDDSAWFDEIDDSSDISASFDSRAKILTTIISTEAEPGFLQSLPARGEHRFGRPHLGIDDGNLDLSSQSPLPGTRISSNNKSSKKRKREKADADDYGAKQKFTKHGMTRHAKKAQLQTSEASDCDQAIEPLQGSTSSAKNPDPTIQNEVIKPTKKCKRRKKGVKAQHPEGEINQTDLDVSIRTENSQDHIPTADREEHRTIDPLRSSEMVEPETQNPSDSPVEFSNDKRAVHSSRELQLNGTQQSPERNEIFKLRRKEAKKARRRAAREVNSVQEECQDEPPEPKLSSDEKDLPAVTLSQTEQDPHTPQDFHSPMIQSVGQLLMRKCPKMSNIFTMNGKGGPILES